MPSLCNLLLQKFSFFFIQTLPNDCLHRPLCRNLGSRVHFLVKVILIDFQLEKYMQSKEKDVYNFFLQY